MDRADHRIGSICHPHRTRSYELHGTLNEEYLTMCQTHCEVLFFSISFLYSQIDRCAYPKHNNDNPHSCNK